MSTCDSRCPDCRVVQYNGVRSNGHNRAEAEKGLLLLLLWYQEASQLLPDDFAPHHSSHCSGLILLHPQKADLLLHRWIP